MKVQDLFEGRYEDRWAKEKAAANRARAQAEKQKVELERASKKIASKPPKPKKPTSDEIYQRVENAVNASFADGDPIDHLIPYMERNGLTMEDIDRAVRKHEGLKRGGLYTWLAGMWDDFQADTISDVRSALKSKRKPDLQWEGKFFTIEGDKVEPTENPWK